jgi:hypothetical protein
MASRTPTVLYPRRGRPHAYPDFVPTHGSDRPLDTDIRWTWNSPLNILLLIPLSVVAAALLASVIV